MSVDFYEVFDPVNLYWFQKISFQVLAAKLKVDQFVFVYFTCSSQQWTFELFNLNSAHFSNDFFPIRETQDIFVSICFKIPHVSCKKCKNLLSFMRKTKNSEWFYTLVVFDYLALKNTTWNLNFSQTHDVNEYKMACRKCRKSFYIVIV